MGPVLHWREHLGCGDVKRCDLIPTRAVVTGSRPSHMVGLPPGHDTSRATTRIHHRRVGDSTLAVDTWANRDDQGQGLMTPTPTLGRHPTRGRITISWTADSPAPRVAGNALCFWLGQVSGRSRDFSCYRLGAATEDLLTDAALARSSRAYACIPRARLRSCDRQRAERLCPLHQAWLSSGARAPLLSVRDVSDGDGFGGDRHGFGCGLDDLGDLIGVGDHRAVVGLDLDSGCAHALGELALGVGRDCLVSGGD
jgi:hypothetical protein